MGIRLSQIQNASRSIEAMRRLLDASTTAPAAPAKPAITLADLLDLSASEQAALISMTETHVKRGLVSRLMAESQDRLCDADFAHLRDLNLCEKPEGYRLNKLTDAGREAAKLLQHALCHRFNIHYLMQGNYSGKESRWTCPCGFSSIIRNSKTSFGNASVQHATHCRTQRKVGELAAALKPKMAEG